MGAESVSSQLMEAATLMLTGMVFVFAFLTMLIGAITLIAKFCQAFPGEPEPVATPKSNSKRTASSPDSQPQDRNVIAAISAAIHMHRKSNHDK
ncbi:OadG family transporter subunit [Alteromonas sp. ASW11-19]|uniref:Probable oxaloacetate decarboxylase gamma chain n=1 Tax=Alteromonas salexigens TaxID=2982530 RepID=A0ABT2VP38_9ALTE|nr:OadG family transporter subunit [Alteromonas salexigens]MCU7555057.1 OadG family transporter subunit [Alteromonas salexigens]